MGAGSGVVMTVAGWVRGATATSRTLVRVPVPVFSTVNVALAVLAVVQEGVAVAAGHR